MIGDGFDDEDRGTPCGRGHEGYCSLCNEVIDSLAAAYRSRRVALAGSGPLCKWDCAREAMQSAHGECEACQRQASRRGRDRDGRPVRGPKAKGAA